MSEVETVAAEAAPAPVTIVETPTPSIEDTMGEVFDKLNPDTRVNRAESGKFESKIPVTEGAEPSDTETVSDQEPTAKAEETASPSIPRPAAWSADRDELWAKLPPEAQEIVAKRESEAHKSITTLGTQAKEVEKYNGVIEKYRAVIGNNEPAAEIDNLFATKAALMRDPVNSIRWLAQQLNINLSQLVPQIGNDVPEAPHVAALHQEIAQLKQQIYGVQNQFTAQRQAETQAKEQTLAQSIDKFAEDPARKESWSEVEDEVLRQVYAIKAADSSKVTAEPMKVLEEAYEKALKLTPAVQAKLEKAAKDEAAKKAASEAKRKADEAKKAASINVRSSGASPRSSSQSMETTMAQVYDRLNATG
jgi:hypothetical protein